MDRSVLFSRQRDVATVGQTVKAVTKELRPPIATKLCGVTAGRAPGPFLQFSFDAARGEGISNLLVRRFAVLQGQTVSALKNINNGGKFYENKIKENL